MTAEAATQRATQSVQSIPRNDEGPVFREPWEAQAFALALSLNERGVFSWNEWAAALGDEIKKAQARRRSRYRRDLLSSLARDARAHRRRKRPHRRASSRTRDAWEHACARTPHGTPIKLGTGDFVE